MQNPAEALSPSCRMPRPVFVFLNPELNLPTTTPDCDPPTAAKTDRSSSLKTATFLVTTNCVGLLPGTACRRRTGGRGNNYVPCTYVPVKVLHIRTCLGELAMSGIDGSRAPDKGHRGTHRRSDELPIQVRTELFISQDSLAVRYGLTGLVACISGTRVSGRQRGTLM